MLTRPLAPGRARKQCAIGAAPPNVAKRRIRIHGDAVGSDPYSVQIIRSGAARGSRFHPASAAAPARGWLQTQNAISISSRFAAAGSRAAAVTLPPGWTRTARGCAVVEGRRGHELRHVEGSVPQAGIEPAA